MYLEIFTLIFAVICFFIFYMYGKGKGKAYYSDYLLIVDYQTDKAYWMIPKTGKQTELDNVVKIANKPVYKPCDDKKENETSANETPIIFPPIY